uniref:Cytochrome c oxidase assembly factor 3 n=1 Tax=Anopheles minimus TaxID=112268 RepID=A0A182WD59_9DIPT
LPGLRIAASFAPFNVHAKVVILRCEITTTARISCQPQKMSSSEAPKSEFKIEGTGRTLKKTEVDFMRLIEQQNLQRVQKLQRQRRNNKLTGIALGGTVLGIYLYSMFSVKQEKFLDDFEEPIKLEVENKALW